MNDGFLHKYFLNNPSKRLHKWNHYFDIYDRHFSRFRNKAPTMIEIGVFGGGSLRMWKEYFGANSKIIGIDINPACKIHEEDGIEIYTGSQDDPELIESIFSRNPHVDIVLDDGSHVMKHMKASFELMYHRVQSTGIYMVEDTHTCYWPEYGGGFEHPDSFMEFTKKRMDNINALHTRGAVDDNAFSKSTDSITCYDSIVVFEKRPQSNRHAPITHGRDFSAEI